ncbi:homeobox protein Meis1-like [Penaeus chinensis]|uniref:homeobox protein Meis1-like n=1 Tax=Penaeus chinensis TaxID=139456 RepID=UPI001FB66F25|nr:homeobox protein Meis1-like [Penaeus chinensis]
MSSSASFRSPRNNARVPGAFSRSTPDSNAFGGALGQTEGLLKNNEASLLPINVTGSFLRHFHAISHKSQYHLPILPSVVSWRAGEGEGRWSSFSPAGSWSHGSASNSASASSSAHFYSPLASDDSYPRPIPEEPPFKARRSESRPNSYYDSRPPIPAAHTSHSNVQAAQPTAHFPPTAHPNAHAAHQMPCAPKEGTGVGVGVGGLSPRKALIQDVVLKESTRAFRSHPLFPLLKDLSVADYYFEKAAFNIGPLLSYLPTSTEDLVTLYFRRNPDVAQSYRCHQTSSHSPAVDAVLLDAIAYAHSCLLEKVSTQAAKLAATVEAEAADTEAAVEEMCQRYMEVIRSSTPLHLFQPLADEPPTSADPPGLESDHLSDPIHQLEQLLAPFSPIPPAFFSAHDSSGNGLMNVSLSASDSRRRTHQHPREAIEVLTAWLTEHRDHPYPDDEQKATLVRRTGLSTQQVAHWFTNARRRLLPKLRADLMKE